MARRQSLYSDEERAWAYYRATHPGGRRLLKEMTPEQRRAYWKERKEKMRVMWRRKNLKRRMKRMEPLGLYLPPVDAPFITRSRFARFLDETIAYLEEICRMDHRAGGSDAGRFLHERVLFLKDYRAGLKEKADTHSLGRNVTLVPLREGAVLHVPKTQEEISREVRNRLGIRSYDKDGRLLD